MIGLPLLIIPHAGKSPSPWSSLHYAWEPGIMQRCKSNRKYLSSDFSEFSDLLCSLTLLLVLWFALDFPKQQTRRSIRQWLYPSLNALQEAVTWAGPCNPDHGLAHILWTICSGRLSNEVQKKRWWRAGEGWTRWSTARVWQPMMLLRQVWCRWDHLVLAEKAVLNMPAEGQAPLCTYSRS